MSTASSQAFRRLRSAALGANFGRVSANTLAVRGKSSVTEGVHRFILEDAVDRDRNRITVRIGYPENIYRNKLVVRRPQEFNTG